MWFKVIMIGLMIVGLLWIIAYYLFQGLVFLNKYYLDS